MKHRQLLHLFAILASVVAGCLGATGIARAGSNLFAGPINSPAGRYPWGLAAGDFDSDGLVDIAVTNNGISRRNQVKVLLGEGTGVFHKPAGYAVGNEPVWVAVGDFNGDGKLDLAVVNSREPGHTGKISLLLGNGDGTFQKQTTYKGGENPLAVVTGDFNGDGKLDLAVAREGKPGIISVLLGNGDGSFQPQIKVPAGHNPWWIAAGDLNGDGKLDLVVAAAVPQFATTALLGNGDGTFRIGWTVHRGASAIALGDFNGDGKLDLAESVPGDPGILEIWLGNGDGTFRSGPQYQVARTPVAMAVADFDGDGILDIAVASQESGEVSVFLGLGNGTFQQPFVFALSPVALPIQMVAADLNGDGKPDLVVTDYRNGVVSVLLNTGHK